MYSFHDTAHYTKNNNSSFTGGPVNHNNPCCFVFISRSKFPIIIQVFLVTMTVVSRKVHYSKCLPGISRGLSTTVLYCSVPPRAEALRVLRAAHFHKFSSCWWFFGHHYAAIPRRPTPRQPRRDPAVNTRCPVRSQSSRGINLV